MSDEMERALGVARAVRDAGGRALIVGGWVRDTLLGLPSKDIDIEVYGLPADALRAVLARLGPVNSVGASFAVFKLGALDVSLPRTESKAGRGHRGFTVSGDPSLPLAAAARRRDFTVNAIAWTRCGTNTLIPTAAAPTSTPAACAWWTPRPSATTACGCCGRCSSRRASSSTWTRRRGRPAARLRSKTCRRNASGGSSTSSCCAPGGHRSASRSRATPVSCGASSPNSTP